jgi:hypothetical protein
MDVVARFGIVNFNSLYAIYLLKDNIFYIAKNYTQTYYETEGVYSRYAYKGVKITQWGPDWFLVY